jgi:hypothetical protein
MKNQSSPTSPTSPTTPTTPIASIINTNYFQANPQKELTGYVGWVITSSLIALYAAWAFLPNSLFEYFGWNYVIDKYWAMAIPAVACAFYMTLYWVNTFWVHYHNPPLDSYQTLQDKHTVYLSDKCLRKKHNDQTRDHIEDDDDDDSDDDSVKPKIPLMKDIPIHTYNELMYYRK